MYMMFCQNLNMLYYSNIVALIFADIGIGWDSEDIVLKSVMFATIVSAFFNIITISTTYKEFFKKHRFVSFLELIFTVVLTILLFVMRNMHYAIDLCNIIMWIPMVLAGFFYNDVKVSAAQVIISYFVIIISNSLHSSLLLINIHLPHGIRCSFSDAIVFALFPLYVFFHTS